MKKFIAFIIAFISVITVSAQCWNPYYYGNKWKTHGFDINVGGCIGSFGKTFGSMYNINDVNNIKITTPNRGIELSFGATVYNVYGDIHWRWPDHISSYKVDKWYDETEYIAWHLGYTFPITHRFSITPLLGMGILRCGSVDGYDYYVSSSGIHNKFNVDETLYSFEYGVKLDIAIVDLKCGGLTLNAKATNHSISGGFGFYFRTN